MHLIVKLLNAKKIMILNYKSIKFRVSVWINCFIVKGKICEPNIAILKASFSENKEPKKEKVQYSKDQYIM